MASFEALNPEAFTAIARRAMGILIGQVAVSEPPAPTIALHSAQDIDAMVQELQVAFVECARTTTPMGLSQDSHLSSVQQEIMRQIHADHANELRRVLGYGLLPAPHITGVRVQLCPVAHTSVGPCDVQARYAVTLLTSSCEKEEGHVQFMCNHAQLQDLVFRLKDACQQVHRIVDAHQVDLPKQSGIQGAPSSRRLPTEALGGGT
mmetsp:Transcript_7889/g.21543  ORF Transcript_7889/g.21543 Transcript_7889/m.21543 type:complete len:206 (+) Transcript_7889:48-665(+)